MAKKFYKYITDINGGLATYDFAANENQYNWGHAITPDSTQGSVLGSVGPTMLAPTLAKLVTNTTIAGPVMWMQSAPRSSDIAFLYDYNGSTYTMEVSGTPTLSELGDLATEDGGAHGNGMAYYNNYMYFAKDTTIARYGPLDGAAAWDKDYWVTTLGMAELTLYATSYRDSGYSETRYPCHVMHRHQGALYIADVNSGQGIINKIKTSDDGSTDDGSTYDVFDLPHGYSITDFESFGEDLVFSALESEIIVDSSISLGESEDSWENRAALFFWDTTAESAYRVIQDEFPDTYISALENANGVLYTFSAGYGRIEPTGCRVMRYLGGNSFEQISYQGLSDVPLPGGTSSRLNQVLWGTINYGYTMAGEGACVMAIGSQWQPLSNSVQVVSGTHGGSYGTVGALLQDKKSSGWLQDTYFSLTNNGYESIESFGANWDYWDTDLRGEGMAGAEYNSIWFEVGKKYKITKVSFVAGAALAYDLYDTRISFRRDRQLTKTDIGAITSTDYSYMPGSTRNRFTFRPENLTGEGSFQLCIEWHGQYPALIHLPIEIEYELYDS